MRRHLVLEYVDALHHYRVPLGRRQVQALEEAHIRYRKNQYSCQCILVVTHVFRRAGVVLVLGLD